MINDLIAARTAAARKAEEERKQAHQAELAPARTPAAARKRQPARLMHLFGHTL
jgi:hypothetical protein